MSQSPNAPGVLHANTSGTTSPDVKEKTSTASAPPSGQRDTQGRFVKGNGGGPGNPFARRTAAMRRAFAEAVTEEDLCDLARKCLEQARQGDTAALRVLLSYTVGKPQPAVDVDTLDEQEWNLWQNKPVIPGMVAELVGAVPANVACSIVRTAWPIVAEAETRKFAEAMRNALPKTGTRPPDPAPSFPGVPASDGTRKEDEKSDSTEAADGHSARPTRSPGRTSAGCNGAGSPGPQQEGNRRNGLTTPSSTPNGSNGTSPAKCRHNDRTGSEEATRERLRKKRWFKR